MALLSSFNEMLETIPLDIYVGPSRKHFMVHRKLLISQSPYFRKMCESALDGSMVTELNLSEEDPAAFELLVEFLYRGKILEYTPKQVEEKPNTLGKISTTKPMDDKDDDEEDDDEEDDDEEDEEAFHSNFQTGTGFWSFQAYVEEDPTNTSTNQQNAFQCITFMNFYRYHSLEELRFSDYIAGRRYGANAFAATANSGFGKPPASSSAPSPQGLFGSTGAASVRETSAATGGSFGTKPGASTGLFGSVGASFGTSAQPAASSLFSGLTSGFEALTQSTASTGSSGSVFGTSTQSAVSSESRAFGTPVGTSTQPPVSSPIGSLRSFGTGFGSPAQSVAPTGFGNIFGPQAQPPTTNLFSGLGPSTTPSLFGAPIQSTTNISESGSKNAISAFAPDAPVSQSSPSEHTQANLPPNQLISAPAFSPFQQATYLNARSESQSPASARSLALLHLCILASKASWKDLYNTAIRPYAKSLTLPSFAGSLKTISKTHVELIYTRTKSGSPLRRLSVDCISHLGPSGTNEFLDFAQTNREFLADIWGQITMTGLGGFGAAKKDGEVMGEGKYDMAFYDFWVCSGCELYRKLCARYILHS